VGYADLDAAAYDLGLSVDNPDDAREIARLAQLDDAVSSQLDGKIGRSFGGTATATARVIALPPRRGFAILSLPFAVRSVESISIAGDGAVDLTADDYVLTNPVERTGDYHAIVLTGGTWPSRESGRSTLTITAIWSDANTGDPVPDDVIEAATFLLVEEFKLRRNGGGDGRISVGGDDEGIFPRNPWNFETVKSVIRRYGAARSRASF
jgi:hypothetical protein